uniref:Uncharacterized protein n=1 Tax=Clastoptera arizonana TaxID=38151 RepID=A0A1B6EEK7_9HEMI
MDKTPKSKIRTLGVRGRNIKGQDALFNKSEFETECLSTNSKQLCTKLLSRSSKMLDLVLHKGKNEDTNHENEKVAACEMHTPIKTQKLPSSCEEESPAQNKDSPNFEPNLSTDFGSPDIEVSWDFTCSQAPRESNFQKRVDKRRKRSRKVYQPLFNLNPFFLPNKGMSEEEKQEKFNSLKQFYANLLTTDLPQSTHNFLKEKHLEDNTKEIEQNISREFFNSFFNDSANDIIFDCTQAVEDILETSQNKPVQDAGNEWEQNILSVNMNQESTCNNNNNNDDDMNLLFDDSVDEMMIKCSQDVEEKLFSDELEIEKSREIVLPRKHHGSPLEKCSKFIKSSYNNSIEKNKPSDKCNNISRVPNFVINEPKMSFSDDTSVNSTRQTVTSKVNKPKSCQATILKHNQPCIIDLGSSKQANINITSLLDDDDAYLTTIDFSKIDDLSDSKENSFVHSSDLTKKGKTYTQLEIEAKRRQALDILRKKRVKI